MSAHAQASPIGRAALARKLSKLIDRAPGASGIAVYDAERERRLFAEDGGDERILASNAKLLTTAAILDRLGAKARLETQVYADGEIDPGADGNGGVLRGDLYLVGDGDPALADRSFADRQGLPVTPFPRLSREIKDAGIERVAGSIFADESIFDRLRGVPDSNWRTSPYIGPLSGLSFNSGIASGGFAAEPALEAGRELVSDLEGRGIGVRGKARPGEASEALQRTEPVARLSSPELATLIDETNRTSNNFFAEMLLKRLAAEGGKLGTTRRGANRVERFARRELGVSVHVVDGSGLTRSNRASPAQVATLLVEMLSRRDGRAFRESLAEAGREGTLSDRMRGTAAEGRCEGKTGTLSGVSALSGYCESPGGTLAFSILMNSAYDLSAARRLQDRMAAAIARYRG